MMDDLKTLCSNLSLDERVELRDYLSETIIVSRLGKKKSALRCSTLMAAMATAMGLPTISYKSREPAHVWGRTMVAYQMIQEGYTYCEIGQQLGRNRATITWLKYKMQDALAFPQGYRDILEIWDNFQKLI